MSNAIPIGLLFLYLAIGGGEPSTAMAADNVTNPEAIPFKTEPDAPAGGISRIVGALVLSLLILFLVAYALRRYVFSSRHGLVGGRIVVRSARRITPQVTAFVIAVDDREYLLMQSRSGLHMVEHTGTPETAESG